MSTQQGAPSRPWFRLSTMIRPPTPPPPPPPAAPASSNQGPPPPRPPFIRPAFTSTASQPTPAVPPPQPTPAPPPRQTSIPTAPQPPPPLPISTDVVEPTTRDPPPKPPSPPPTTPSPPSEALNSPPSPPKSQSTRNITPPSSPTKLITKNPPPSPSSTTKNALTPPPTTPSPKLQKSPISSPPPSPPRKTRFNTSPPSSPRVPPPMQLSEHPLPPSSPPTETSTTTKPLSPLQLPSSLKQKSYNDDTPQNQPIQKTMHVQEIKEKPMTTGLNNVGRHIGGTATHTQNSTKRPETQKKHVDTEDGKNIITIAGDNKGAIMNLTTPFGDKKHESNSRNIHISRHNPTTSSINEEKLETDSKSKNQNLNSKSLLKTAFLNSNVQGINNSIVYNSSINHHDPGIHLTLSAKPDGHDSDNIRSKNDEHGNII